jgi:hypothetical protein
MYTKGETMNGTKHDQGKPQFRLIPQHALLEVAKVMTFGAQKYEPNNWMMVQNGHDRYIDAAQRHINAHLRGEMIDPESGFHHLSHAICSLMMAQEMD